MVGVEDTSHYFTSFEAKVYGREECIVPHNGIGVGGGGSMYPKGSMPCSGCEVHLYKVELLNRVPKFCHLDIYKAFQTVGCVRYISDRQTDMFLFGVLYKESTLVMLSYKT